MASQYGPGHPHGGNGHQLDFDVLAQRTQRVRDDFADMTDVARQTVHEWEGILRDRLIRRPYATLAVAAGIGYVLGGGLPRVLTRAMIATGGHLLLERLLTGASSRMTENLP